MNLELTPREAEVLSVLVAEAVREVGPEIHHTDSRPYRAQLVERQRILESLLQRLGGSPAPAKPGA